MNRERIYQVIRVPHESEKATRLADTSNQHVFRVAPAATKREVRKAVETLFDVRVEKVQLLNVKGKRKRFGQVNGRRDGWRKAVVRLTAGGDIDYARFHG